MGDRLHKFEQQILPRPWQEKQPHELTDAELAAIAGVDLNDPDLDAKLEQIVRQGVPGVPEEDQP